ncbi:MAG TPA: HDOD domain-containing protein [Gemmatimonadaceae bacterium]|jgi:EAL and modified HD-GYP domain-containing signal transduction protein
MSSIYVARQPIFELGKGLFGYELLYRRDSTMQHADGEDGYMSAEVIVGSLLGIGLRAIAGGGAAFVNFSRAQLVNRSWELFEPGEVVIELLENIECSEDTLAACQEMVAAGYRLALDDYIFDEATQPLLELASIVKIDVLNRQAHDLAVVAQQLSPFGVRLLAERVETAQVRDRCADMGYELFQGYLFSRPETLTKTDVSASQLAIMRLLNLLQDPSTPDAILDSAFQSDVALCYKLLRIVNAASVGGRGITSIPHAVRMVGRETLHRWLAVILVASLGQKGDVTHEIALTAITRARMCELLAAGSSDQRPGSAFIVGLLSLLDVLLEVPMDKILSRLELSDEVRGALLGRGGPLGQPLQLVEAYERADWTMARDIATRGDTTDEQLPSMYIDALHWAAQRIAS